MRIEHPTSHTLTQIVLYCMKRKLKLEVENCHERDKRIRFDEPTHTYTLDGEKLKGSVSAFYHEFFSHFNAPQTIGKCYAKWSRNADFDNCGYALLYMKIVDGLSDWSDAALRLKSIGVKGQEIAEHRHMWEGDGEELKDKNYFLLIRYLKEYHVMSDDVIKREIASFWTRMGTLASSAGTAMHLALELKANSEEYDATLPEMRLHEQFCKDYPQFVPYRTEWSIFSSSLKLAGQIDLIARDMSTSPPTYVMIDFKRCAQLLTRENPYKKFGFGPFANVPDTPYGLYSCQQGIYKWLVEKLYGIKISHCYLLQMHQNMTQYHFIETIDVQAEVGEAMKLRRAKIKELEIS